MPKISAELVAQGIDAAKRKLNLVRQQITNTEALSDLVPESVLNIDLSFNCLRTVGHSFDGLAETLQYLDLSTNMLAGFEGLTNLSRLVVLRLSRNRLTRIEGLESLVNLQALDVSMNSITQLENLSHLTTLQILYVYGNQLDALENIDQLSQLKELRIEQNRIKDINHLAQFRPPLTLLNAHSNDIRDLDDVIVVLNQLPELQHLTLYNNPVAEELTYQFRIVVLKNLQKFDGLIIKDYIRDAVAGAKDDYDLEQFYESTRQAYGGLVAKEKAVKDSAMHLIREQEKQIEEDFQRYRVSLDKELDALNQFIYMTRKRRLGGEDISRDQAKIEEWKSRIEKLQQERDESIRQRKLRLEHEISKGIEDRMSTLDLTGKLYELSQADPRNWREIKENLWKGKLTEAQRAGERPDESEENPESYKEVMEQEGLNAVMENMGGAVAEKADARLSQEEDRAIKKIQAKAKQKSGACELQ